MRRTERIQLTKQKRERGSTRMLQQHSARKEQLLPPELTVRLTVLNVHHYKGEDFTQQSPQMASASARVRLHAAAEAAQLLCRPTSTGQAP